jgi:hypothetical protein
MNAGCLTVEGIVPDDKDCCGDRHRTYAGAIYVKHIYTYIHTYTYNNDINNITGILAFCIPTFDFIQLYTHTIYITYILHAIYILSHTYIQYIQTTYIFSSSKIVQQNVNLFIKKK